MIKRLHEMSQINHIQSHFDSKFMFIKICVLKIMMHVIKVDSKKKLIGLICRKKMIYVNVAINRSKLRAI